MDEYVSVLLQSIGSRHYNVLINADIFVVADVIASIQVTNVECTSASNVSAR